MHDSQPQGRVASGLPGTPRPARFSVHSLPTAEGDGGDERFVVDFGVPTYDEWELRVDVSEHTATLACAPRTPIRTPRATDAGRRRFRVHPEATPV